MDALDAGESFLGSFSQGRLSELRRFSPPGVEEDCRGEIDETCAGEPTSTGSGVSADGGSLQKGPFENPPSICSIFIHAFAGSGVDITGDATEDSNAFFNFDAACLNMFRGSDIMRSRILFGDAELRYC